jgi:WhiB family redox-sensing transcriptional regulator
MRASTIEAKKFCDSCRVRKQCLDFAMENNIYVGIYGGFSNNQRRALKQEMGVKAVRGRKTGWNK